MAPASESHQRARGATWTDRLKPVLQSYFCSGWAFFIPYLLAYILYAWLKWPANPDLEGGTITDTGVPRHGSVVPPLLHVYWALHLLHLVLAAWALRSWWRSVGPGAASSPLPTGRSSAHEALRRHWVHWLHPILPWVLLALIFYIPGVYLEWPSDPWEHLRRITEWQTHATVAGHSAGYKSFYFFAYSLFGWMSPGPLLRWLNVYYVGIALVLAWQYYRLARVVGLDSRWATAFVILNCLTFGNTTFSFYRYYGLASTMFAQIAAVALTRTFLVWISSRLQGSNEFPNTGCIAKSTPPTCWIWISRLFTGTLLLALIANSHVQGLGIAALGVAAITIWRLIEWKRSMALWILATLAIMNVAAVGWWPRHWIMDAMYRQSGWMNTWYGFDILSVESGAFERTTQIFGIVGLVNIFAGLWLLRRNEIVGWLTVTPVVALLLPILAIPFANVLAESGSIIAFHRMFLGVPSGLALIFVAKQLLNVTRGNLAAPFNGFPSFRFVASSVGLLCLASIVLLPGSRPSYNRAWHTLSRTPNDLQARTIIAAARLDILDPPGYESAVIISSDAVGSMLHDSRQHRAPRRDRHQINGSPITASVEETCSAIRLVDDMRRRNRYSLTSDPLAANPLSWKLLGGIEPDFIEGARNLQDIKTAIQNKPGKRTNIFSSDLIPVSSGTQYIVTVSVIQLEGPAAVVSPAIVWYDEDRHLLVSNVESPLGAGRPPGWSNGTYSYFGCTNRDAPRAWTTYYRPFGAGTKAGIPKNARFCRVGAILNHTEKQEVVQQVTNIRLWAESAQRHAHDMTMSDGQAFRVVVPPARTLVSVGSQGGRYSSHWPANQVASDLSGSNEITLACESAGGFPLGDAVFLLNPYLSSPLR